MSYSPKQLIVGCAVAALACLATPLLTLVALGWGSGKASFSPTFKNASSEAFFVKERVRPKVKWWDLAQGAVPPRSSRRLKVFQQVIGGGGFELGVFRHPNDPVPVATVALTYGELYDLDEGRSALRISEGQKGVVLTLKPENGTTPSLF